MRLKLRKFLETLEHSRLAPLLQFFKFGLVGLSNTALSYGIEMLCYYALFVRVAWPERVRIVVATALAFLAGTLNSYYWNHRYVFTGGEKKTAADHLRTFFKMALCYGFTGLLLAPVVKVWIREQGVAYWLASLSTMLFTVPLNFLINKFWAFR